MGFADRPLTLTLSTTEPLPNAATLGESSAVAVGAELQVLLAEVKRLSMHQEHLKKDVADICAWEAQDGATKSDKKRAVPQLHGCNMTDGPGPVLTVPFGKQYTAGSSDWSEAAIETPVRNVISGGYTSFTVAKDLLKMDLSPANEESDSGSTVGETAAPAALPLPAGLTPDQLRRARRHRRKYGLAHAKPNSPKPKKLSSQKNSRFGITISRAREILGMMTTTHTAEAQKKSLQKLMTQKSHSFTGGVPPGRFDDMYASASPAATQFVARRFDDVVSGHHSPKQAALKLARQAGSISAATMTNSEPGSPCTGSGFERVERQAQRKLMSQAQKLMSQAVYREAEQEVAEQRQVELPQTYIRTDTMQNTYASTIAERYSDDDLSAQHIGSATLMASNISTSAINRQVRREYEALVADESQPAAVAAAKAAADVAAAAAKAAADVAAYAQIAVKGPRLEEMEAQDLLALLASLGAQQQAVLSAIAAKQQPVQKAPASRQPAPGALQPSPSSLVPKGQGVDISVAAGYSAAQAQLHRSNWRI